CSRHRNSVLLDYALASSSLPLPPPLSYSFFFFNDPATSEIYTLSLHDALPIFKSFVRILDTDPGSKPQNLLTMQLALNAKPDEGDRKSTRLNSSHVAISYAVFCLKKKKKNQSKKLHTKHNKNEQTHSNRIAHDT